MRRSTVNSASLSLLKATSAGALVLAFAVACSDSNGPRVPKDGIPVAVQQIRITIPDSVKLAADQFTAALLAPPRAISANGFASPTAVFSRASSSCSTGGSDEYTVANLPLPFTPEPIPIYTPDESPSPDGIIALPLEFDFVFFGNTYNTVHVYSNGFLRFGTLESDAGYAKGGLIPDPEFPNNIIAFAWGDWEPQGVPGAIRFETRGRAPDRMFIVQFTNVPEWGGRGMLMAQVVLHEGSNAISMYTNKMSTTRIGARVTQGIENEDGFLAFVGPTALTPGGLPTPRVKAVFTLTEDQIRFTPVGGAADTEAPSITAPANLEGVRNDPGLGSAVIASLGSPIASDNCALEGDPIGARSDGKALDAPYPVGFTTITWTAKDASGNVATASQSIEVIDWEDPSLTVPASFSRNATSSLGVVEPYAFSANDNVAVTSLVCEQASGSRFPIGTNTVTCTASDAAGNSISKSFEIYVVDAPTQLTNLLQYLLGLGLSSGTTNPLANELQFALGEPGSAMSCKKMSDFLSMLIKKSRDIPSAEVAYMTNEAKRIRTVMECR